MFSHCWRPHVTQRSERKHFPLNRVKALSPVQLLPLYNSLCLSVVKNPRHVQYFFVCWVMTELSHRFCYGVYLQGNRRLCKWCKTCLWFGGSPGRRGSGEDTTRKRPTGTSYQETQPSASHAPSTSTMCQGQGENKNHTHTAGDITVN